MSPAPADTQPATNTTRLPDLKRSERALFVVACLLATAVSVLGLLSSFTTLEKQAGAWGWDQAWMLPAGIDLSIPAFTLAALLLIRVDMPLAWVAWVPRLLTGATVYLNWEAAHSLPGQIGHAALTLLWVVFSEIAGHVYASRIGAVTGTRIDKIRRIRWILAPISTLIMWRYMRLWETCGYQTVVAHRREATIFRARMRAEHGWWWRRHSDLATEKLALKLSRVGVPIQDTLNAPRRQAEEQRRLERERQEEARRIEAARQIEAEERRRREEAARAEQWRRDEQEARQKQLADAQLAAQLAEIQRAQQTAEQQARDEAWRAEQARKRTEAENAERLAQAARERADAERRAREEADKRRQAEAALRQMAPRPATPSAPRGATAGATEAPPRAPRAHAPGRPEHTPQGATASRHGGATKPATSTPRKTPSKRHAPATRGAAKDAIKALYTTHQRRPLESEMVAELLRIKSKHTSRQYANKLRTEIEKDHPELAALGSDNVRPLTGS